MNKFLTTILIYCLTITSVMAGLPPTTLSGEAQTLKPTTFNYKVPNNQATQTSGINSRIETGNKNLLTNPSFEHSTILTGWSITGGGTPASSTTNLHDGAKSVTTTSTGAWTFYQDSTLYATAKSGQEAEASIWVYSATASADLWLCPRVNGASVTASVANGCQQYTSLGSPQKLTVFPLYGSTSTGIEIKGSGAITYILDDAYLGDRRPSVLGVTTSPSVDSGITGSTTGWQAFGTPSSVNIKATRVGGSLYLWGTFTSGTQTNAEPRIPLPTVWGTITVADSTKYPVDSPIGTIAFNANGGGGQYFLGAHVNGVSYLNWYSQPAASGYVLATTNGPLPASGSIYYISAGPIQIAEWQNDNNSNTTRCDDPRNCNTKFSLAATTTSGTISSQDGGSSFPWVSSCTAANPSVCTFSASLGITVTPNCSAKVGATAIGTSASVTAVSSSSVSVQTFTTSTGAAAASIPFVLDCAKQGVDETSSRVSQQVIQGRGVPQVSGIASPKIFSASITSTSGVITNQQGTNITSCTAANPTVCTLNSLTASPNCVADISGNTLASVSTSAESSTGITFTTTTASTGVALASQTFKVFCQGQ